MYSTGDGSVRAGQQVQYAQQRPGPLAQGALWREWGPVAQAGEGCDPSREDRLALIQQLRARIAQLEGPSGPIPNIPLPTLGAALQPQPPPPRGSARARAPPPPPPDSADLSKSESDKASTPPHGGIPPPPAGGAMAEAVRAAEQISREKEVAQQVEEEVQAQEQRRLGRLAARQEHFEWLEQADGDAPRQGTGVQTNISGPKVLKAQVALARAMGGMETLAPGLAVDGAPTMQAQLAFVEMRVQEAEARLQQEQLLVSQYERLLAMRREQSELEDARAALEAELAAEEAVRGEEAAWQPTQEEPPQGEAGWQPLQGGQPQAPAAWWHHAYAHGTDAMAGGARGRSSPLQAAREGPSPAPPPFFPRGMQTQPPRAEGVPFSPRGAAPEPQDGAVAGFLATLGGEPAMARLVAMGLTPALLRTFLETRTGKKSEAQNGSREGELQPIPELGTLAPEARLGVILAAVRAVIRWIAAFPRTHDAAVAARRLVVGIAIAHHDPTPGSLLKDVHNHERLVWRGTPVLFGQEGLLQQGYLGGTPAQGALVLVLLLRLLLHFAHHGRALVDPGVAVFKMHPGAQRPLFPLTQNRERGVLVAHTQAIVNRLQSVQDGTLQGVNFCQLLLDPTPRFQGAGGAQVPAIDPALLAIGLGDLLASCDGTVQGVNDAFAEFFALVDASNNPQDHELAGRTPLIQGGAARAPPPPTPSRPGAVVSILRGGSGSGGGSTPTRDSGQGRMPSYQARSLTPTRGPSAYASPVSTPGGSRAPTPTGRAGYPPRPATPGRALAPGACRNCGQEGHYARECKATCALTRCSMRDAGNTARHVPAQCIPASAPPSRPASAERGGGGGHGGSGGGGRGPQQGGHSPGRSPSNGSQGGGGSQSGGGSSGGRPQHQQQQGRGFSRRAEAQVPLAALRVQASGLLAAGARTWEGELERLRFTSDRPNVLIPQLVPPGTPLQVGMAPPAEYPCLWGAIGTVPVQCALDTGCNVSLISKELVKKAGATRRRLDSPLPMRGALEGAYTATARVEPVFRLLYHSVDTLAAGLEATVRVIGGEVTFLVVPASDLQIFQGSRAEPVSLVLGSDARMQGPLRAVYDISDRGTKPVDNPAALAVWSAKILVAPDTVTLGARYAEAIYAPIGNTVPFDHASEDQLRSPTNVFGRDGDDLVAQPVMDWGGARPYPAIKVELAPEWRAAGAAGQVWGTTSGDLPPPSPPPYAKLEASAERSAERGAARVAACVPRARPPPEPPPGAGGESCGDSSDAGWRAMRAALKDPDAGARQAAGLEPEARPLAYYNLLRAVALKFLPKAPSGTCVGVIEGMVRMAAEGDPLPPLWRNLPHARAIWHCLAQPVGEGRELHVARVVQAEGAKQEAQVGVAAALAAAFTEGTDTWDPATSNYNILGSGLGNANVFVGEVDITNSAAFPEVPATREDLLEKLLKHCPSHSRNDFWDHYLDKLVDVLWKRKEVFAAPRGRGEPITFKVREDATPIISGYYRQVKLNMVDALWAECMEHERKGFISRVPVDPITGKPPPDLWINPLCLTAKPPPPGSPPGTPFGIRVTVDARELNARLADVAATLLPNLSDHVAGFQGKSLFSALDLSNAFHQIPIAEECRKYLGFTVPCPTTGERVYFVWNVLIMGLTQAPQQFQMHIERVLAPLHWADALTRVSAFVDNVDIATANRPSLGSTRQPMPGTKAADDLVERHLASLDLALEGMLRGGFTLNLKKCFFMVDKAYSCGVIADGLTTQLDPERFRALEALQVPAKPTLKYVQSVLGFVNYTQPYIPSKAYVQHTGPLFDLCVLGAHAGKDGDRVVSSSWQPSHTACVHALLAEVKANHFILAPPPGATLYMDADASDMGGGAVVYALHPETGHPLIVYTMARRWTKAQRSWSIGAREAFATLLFLRKYWHILAFHKVYYNLDHANLLQQEHLDSHFVKRWHAELLMLAPTWLTSRAAIPGPANPYSDFLSRWCIAAPTSRDLAPKVKGKRMPYTTLLQPYAGADATPFVDEDEEGDALDGWAASLGRKPTTTSTTPAVAGAPTEEPVTNQPTPPTPGRARVSRPHAPTGAVGEFHKQHTWQPGDFVKELLAAQSAMTPAELQQARGEGVATRTIQGQSLLTCKGGLYVPLGAKALRDKIFGHVHADATLHAGPAQAHRRLRDCNLHVAGFQRLFKEYYDSCICQFARAPKTLPPTADLLPYPLFPALSMLQMDVMYLPESEEGLNAVVVTIDTTSRRLHLHPTTNSTAAKAVEALQQWRRAVGRNPVAVDHDGGPTFKGAFLDYLKAQGIEDSKGTAHNHVGRGLVERAIRTIKYSICCILPRGKLALWPGILGELEVNINNTPRDSLGGISPFQYLTNVSDPPAAMAVEQPPPLTEEQLHTALGARQWLANRASELASILNAVNGPQDGLTYNVGDWVMLCNEHKPDDGLVGDWTAPFVVTDAEMATTAEGKKVHTGWYSVARLLANSKQAAPKRVRGTRLWGFNASRTSADEQHQESLPPGFFVVKTILDHGLPGSPNEGRVLVQYCHTPTAVWQPVDDLRGNQVYRAYCIKHNLSLEGLPVPRKGAREASAPPVTSTATTSPATEAPFPTAVVPPTTATGGAAAPAAGGTSFMPGEIIMAPEGGSHEMKLATIIQSQQHGFYEVQWLDGSSSKRSAKAAAKAVVHLSQIQRPSPPTRQRATSGRK